MNDPIDPSWRIFIDQYPQFMKLMRKLAATDWYVEDGWVMFVGYYHAGIYMQLYKAHWYNNALEGIHIELGLSNEALKKKQAQIDLHIGHRNLFDRARFNELTLDRMANITADWSNCTFSRKNLSERLSVTVPFTKSGFATQLAAALAQISALGPIIDDGLAQL